MENDEKYYEIVAKEIRQNRINDAVWTKAIAESGGDENKTKAVYIQLRVKQLMRDDVKTQYNGPAEPEPGQAPTETWDDSEEYDSGDSPFVLQLKSWGGKVGQVAVFVIGIYAIWKWLWPWLRSVKQGMG
ncbi:MAG: hypothetical protein ACI9VS_002497 [Candidatus Binatia bacterium]|jgi:hypothetical protein|tara:strand:+ start:85 stop:474 length:390 start_codon:yes stop_codon:yes gene_type:complete